jgi:hypothetical protein
MSSAIARAVTALQFTMTGNLLVEGVVSIATTATAFGLGGVTQPHWAWFKNLDAANYVQLQNGASGAVFARLVAGEVAIVPLDPSMVPYGIANTAAVLVEYMIFSL